MEPGPLDGERRNGAWMGAVRYNTLFCAFLCILGCTLFAGGGEGAGREHRRAPAAGRPPAAFPAH